MPRAVDPERAKAERRRAHDVPAVRRHEYDLLRTHGEAIGDERVDFAAAACTCARRRPRARRRAIGAMPDASTAASSMRGEPLDRIAVRKAARLERGDGGARVGKGVELQIGFEQFRPQRAVDRRHARQCVVERALGQASRNRRSVRRASTSSYIRAALTAKSRRNARPPDRRRRDGARSRHARRTACRRRRRRKRAT